MLHPQARALMDRMAAEGVKPVHTLTVAEARLAYLARQRLSQGTPPSGVNVRELQVAPEGVPPLTLRVYRPAEAAAPQALPALLYLHGGGWTIGDLNTHDTLCRQLCVGAGVVVVSVDYRLGPEHRFPAAVDDADAALRWVQLQAQALGIDPQRLAVGGDSAGGNLAAVVALMARDRALHSGADAVASALKLQLLLYPSTDMRMGAPSHTANGEGYMLTHEAMKWYRSHYLNSQEEASDWRASPWLHPSLAGVAPALVVTAGLDPLLDEGRLYAQRLGDEGVPTTYLCFERQIHGFMLMGGVFEETQAGVDLCCSALRRALHG